MRRPGDDRRVQRASVESLPFIKRSTLRLADPQAHSAPPAARRRHQHPLRLLLPHRPAASAPPQGPLAQESIAGGLRQHPRACQNELCVLLGTRWPGRWCLRSGRQAGQPQALAQVRRVLGAAQVGSRRPASPRTRPGLPPGSPRHALRIASTNHSAHRRASSSRPRWPQAAARQPRSRGWRSGSAIVIRSRMARASAWRRARNRTREWKCS